MKCFKGEAFISTQSYYCKSISLRRRWETQELFESAKVIAILRADAFSLRFGTFEKNYSKVEPTGEQRLISHETRGKNYHYKRITTYDGR